MEALHWFEKATSIWWISIDKNTFNYIYYQYNVESWESLLYENKRYKIWSWLGRIYAGRICGGRINSTRFKRCKDEPESIWRTKLSPMMVIYLTLFGLYYKLRKISQSCYRKVTEKLFLDVLKITRKEIMENIFQNSNRLWKIEADLASIDGSYSHNTNTENHLEYNKRGKDWC